MTPIPKEIYHVYNRGINRQLLFYEKENYDYFLSKTRTYLSPYCDMIAYCLMPNHFHFLIRANEKTNLPFQYTEGMTSSNETNPYIFMSKFSHGLQLLLSSYAKAMNHRHNRTGSLFTQNTRSKRTSSEAFSMDYTLWCFLYIHNNPVALGLVFSAKDWEFSSYREYLGNSTDPICNIELGKEILSMEINELVDHDGYKIPDHIITKLF